MSPSIMTSNGFRRLGAALIALPASLPFVLHERLWDSTLHGHEALLVAAVMFSVPVGGLLLLVPSFGAALFGRAVLWSMLVWVTLISFIGPVPPTWIVLMGLAAGVSLILVGSVGLESSKSSSHFAPVALRAPLVAIVVMSMADGLALTFLGMLSFDSSRAPTSFLLGGAVVMAVVVWGLLRLRAWAFGLNVVANVLIAGGAWALVAWGGSGIRMPEEVALCLTATAIGQLLMGLPLAIGLVRGGATPSPTLGRGPLVGSALVLGLMVALVVRTYVLV